MATAVFLLAIFTDALPWLRGPAPDSDVWHWPYLLRPVNRWWLAIVAGIFFLAVLGWWLRQQNSRRWQTAVALLLLFVGCLGLQWGILYADRPQRAAELVDRTLAVQTNGYFWTAANIDSLGRALEMYPTLMPQFESDHARTHPPGLVAANWLTIRVARLFPSVSEQLAQQVYPLRCTDLWLLDGDTAVAAGLGIWAVLPLIFAAATIFPAYALAKSLTDQRGIAKLATLVALIPALLLFAPLPDQQFALLTLLIIIAYQHGWQQQKASWLFISGIFLSLATFLSIGNVALLILLGSYTLILLWQQRQPVHSVLPQLVIFGLGAASVWLLYWLGWGVSPWAVVQVGLNEHFALVTAQRSYLIWLSYNLLDLAIFVGLPIMVAFLAAILMAIRKIKREPLSEAEVLAVATAVLILVLNLSGSTRGEVGRIWLFFMPLIALTGSIWLARWLPNWRWQWAWAGLQLLWAIGLGLSWQPVEATIVRAEQPTFSALPSNAAPANVHFGSQILLERIAVEKMSEAIIVTLAWQAEGRNERPYTVFNHLVDAEGNIVAQADGWSVDGEWPPTCWQPGQAVVDQHQITLPSNLPPGSYTVRTGLYDARDGTRVLTQNGADHTVSGRITIP